MKKIITTMSAMTIAAQFNGAQTEQPEQLQPVYNDLKVGYADENNFQGSGFVDLSVEKTVTLLADNDDSGTVTAYDTLSYRIKINNLDSNFGVNNIVLDDFLEPKLNLILGSVTTSDGSVVVGNNPYDGNRVLVEIDQVAADWFTLVNFEARVGNLNPGLNIIYNQAVVVDSSGRYVFSDDPTTSEPDDPTLIDAYGTYPDLIFDDGFEGSASGGFF